MSATSPRFANIRRMVVFSCVAAILGGAALIAYGALREDADLAIRWIATGCLIALAGLVVMGLVELFIKIESNTQRQYGELFDLREMLGRYERKLDDIAASVSISESSKSIAHRDRELDALRKAVRDDIHAHKWDTAFYLVSEMQRRYGIEEEAERLRREVQEARAKVFRNRLKQAIERVETLLADRSWVTAKSEIDRLHRVLPDEPHVTGLYEALRRHRDAHKKELMDAWSDALRKDDIDGGIEILKELDQYLTRPEATALEASARDVFKRKLLQFRFQFQYAVSEKRWTDALDVAQQIINEYPNSRMAEELRDRMPVMRVRAGLTVDATAAQAAATESDTEAVTAGTIHRTEGAAGGQ